MKMKIKNIGFVIVINVIILIVIELMLRILNIGYDPSLIYKTKIAGEEYLYLNKNYVLKYFNRDDIDPTGPNNCLFKEKKPENTFRIYVIGESTSRGFPYSRAVSFPFQLEQMLNAAKLDRQFEVINFSMDATDSYIGLDIMNEILKYPPDLAIIYYGNNEFIGIGGQGEYHKFFFQMNKKLSCSRIYQLFKRGITKITKKENKLFIEKMAGKNPVAYKSETYNSTINDFTSNYTRMIEKLSANNIEVIACGVARNLKDFKPGNSTVSPGFVNQIEQIYDTSDVKLFEKIEALSGNRAGYCFEAAKFLLQKGQKDMANSFFEKTCTFDDLRLRAPYDINNTIRNLAERYKIHYINIQETINTSDSTGVAGDDEMLEHVHPNLAMHTKIADQLATEIENIKWGGQNRIRPKPLIYRSIIDDIYETNGLMNLFENYPLKKLGYFNKHSFENIYIATTNDVSGLRYRKDINLSQIMLVLPLFSDFKDLEKIHLKYGAMLYHSFNLNGAYLEFELAYLQNPMDVLALNNLAVISYSKGDKQNGLLMQTMVHDQKPGYIAGMINLWMMLKDSGRNQEAGEMEKKLKKKNIDLKTFKNFLIDEYQSENIIIFGSTTN